MSEFSFLDLYIEMFFFKIVLKQVAVLFRVPTSGSFILEVCIYV